MHMGRVWPKEAQRRETCWKCSTGFRVEWWRHWRWKWEVVWMEGVVEGGEGTGVMLVLVAEEGCGSDKRRGEGGGVR